ncbi:hypothetical protein ADIAL_0872 [Alkalibacterium sp. AK22]|uniref:hypothetical protein n=1 Tax=Alkalibacterium sp. AK22 TaxID=1229520 RepID=UPI000446A6D2|nr:hypothetical protein [Alkalibacterium sp. AK22]EXJ23609.1 hypothetical protein ADIAL_0872 [Alkalibacterium sp. AK22]
MDNLQINFKLLESVISNVIRREIDCFTDEVYKAKEVYLTAEEDLTEYIRPFMHKLNANELDLHALKEVSDEALLICVADKKLSKERVEHIQRFNLKGRVTLITTDYEYGEVLNSRETIGISLPTTVSSDRQRCTLFRQAVTMILDDVLLKLDSKGSSRLISY